MDYNDIQEKLEDMQREMFEDMQREMFEECVYVSADALGLDVQAGMVYVSPAGYVGDGFIACNSPGSLDYYGGFEYVDKDCITHVGGTKIYSGEDSRVAGCLEHYNENLHSTEL